MFSKFEEREDLMKRLIETKILNVLKAKAMEIRIIPEKVTNKEVSSLPVEKQPFLYASGNWGPGYISIKGLIGRKKIIKSLIAGLVLEITEKARHLDFVAGNVTGGLAPGWILSEFLEPFLGKTVPFVYVRDARKKGGQKELVTGITNNPEIEFGDNVIVVEELVNFAETTRNSAEALRKAGYEVTHATCILFYNNPEAIRSLKEAEINMIHLFTLPELLDVAEKHQTHPQENIDGYREFLKDPLGWQAKRGLIPVEKGGTK